MLSLGLFASPRPNWATTPDATTTFAICEFGQVTGVTGAVGSVTGGVTVTTNNDKTGYALTAGERTSIATAIWQDSTGSDFTAASSIGKSLYTTGNAPGAARDAEKVIATPDTMFCALSAVDFALWDLKGKLLGVPVYSLIGGPCREALECYCTSDDLDWSMELGFRAFKISNPVHYEEGTEGINRLEEKVAKARETVGPDADLMLNPVMSYNVEFAARVMERLQPYRLRWIEEPLVPIFMYHRYAVESASSMIATFRPPRNGLSEIAWHSPSCIRCSSSPMNIDSGMNDRSSGFCTISRSGCEPDATNVQPSHVPQASSVSAPCDSHNSA